MKVSVNLNKKKVSVLKFKGTMIRHRPGVYIPEGNPTCRIVVIGKEQSNLILFVKPDERVEKAGEHWTQLDVLYTEATDSLTLTFEND